LALPSNGLHEICAVLVKEVCAVSIDEENEAGGGG